MALNLKYEPSGKGAWHERGRIFLVSSASLFLVLNIQLPNKECMFDNNYVLSYLKDKCVYQLHT